MLIDHLENGMPVILKRVPNKVVTLDVWVNTGSANEDESLSGVSHFLEHMLFKGTRRYGVGELDKTITNVGGVWNAGTSKDFTHYYVTAAAPFFLTALDAISDMIQDAQIDPDEFAKEKHVILEEYRRKEDNPWGLMFDELYESAYEHGPYRRSVIGTFESISALTRAQMFDYYERYYAPANMVLIITGDVDPQEALGKVREAFSAFTRPFQPLSLSESRTLFSAGGLRRLRKDVNETYLAFAWPGPSIERQTEVFALDLAATILGEGRSSRLFRILKEEKRIVNAISAGFPAHRYDSLFYVGATLDAGKRDETIGEVTRVLRGLAADPPKPAELAKAKRIISNQFCFSTETNTGQSGTIGFYYTLTGSTTFLDEYIPRLMEVSAADVQDAAAKYLTSEPNAVAIEPSEDPSAVASARQEG